MPDEIPRASDTPRPEGGLAWILGEAHWMAALLTGVVLRSLRLGEQIVVYDEWHALRSAIELTPFEVYTRFGEHSAIPLSLYYQAWLAAGHLGTWALRLPFWIAGVLLLAWLPRAARPWLGRGASDVLAWLLALSPILVYHSRFARPYALGALAAAVALVAAIRFAGRPSLHLGALVAGGVVVSCFATLAHAGFAGACLLLIGIAAIRRPGGGGVALPAWLALCAATALGLALCLGPALWFDLDTVQEKLVEGDRVFDVGSLLRFATGMLHDAAAWTLLGATLLGGVVLARDHPKRLAWLGLPVAVHVFEVWILQPRQIHDPQVLYRYLLPSLLVGFALASVGVDWLLRRVARVESLRSTLLAAFAAGLLLLGPLGVVVGGGPTNWPMELVVKRMKYPQMDPAKLSPAPSPLYRRLGALPPESLTIVEAPSSAIGLYDPYPFLQLRHRQRTWVATEGGACENDNEKALPFHRALRIRGFHQLGDLERLATSGADLLLVHRAPSQELSFGGPSPRGWKIRGDGCIEVARNRFGEPVYEDGRLAAFALSPAGRAAAGSR